MKKEIYISKGVGETRIAVKENGKLAELHVDKQSQVKTVGNIYKGIVENLYHLEKKELQHLLFQLY